MAIDFIFGNIGKIIYVRSQNIISKIVVKLISTWELIVRHFICNILKAHKTQLIHANFCNYASCSCERKQFASHQINAREVFVVKLSLLTYPGYPRGSGRWRNRCWERRWCPCQVAGRIVCAEDLAYRDRGHASNWSSSRFYQENGRYRSRWTRIRASGRDATDWAVVL